jgi:hypothetical protein
MGGFGMLGNGANSLPLGPASGLMGMAAPAPVFAAAPVPLPTAPAAPPAPAVDAPSRLLLLENLVDPEEVDGELQGEVAEEVGAPRHCRPPDGHSVWDTTFL